MITRSNCKLCNSLHREEAERLFLSSHDRKAVERWLIEQGEDISYNGVKNHFKRHMTDTSEESSPIETNSAADSLDGLAIIEEVQALTLRQVRKLAAVRTNEQNIASVSSAYFRGAALLGNQVELKARLLGYYQPVDATTWFQLQGAMQTLRALLSQTTPEQKEILAPFIKNLEAISLQPGEE